MTRLTTDIPAAKTLTVPGLHLNGSDGPALLQALVAAEHAVHLAGDALAETTPHGRDYYPQGEAAYPQARAEHVDRSKRLDSVREELAALARAVQQQIEDRAARRGGR